MTNHVCPYCGYVYRTEIGDPAADVAPGTSFEALPEDWLCPECGGEKQAFIIE